MFEVEGLLSYFGGVAITMGNLRFMGDETPEQGAGQRSARRADDDPDDLDISGRPWPRGRGWPPGSPAGGDESGAEDPVGAPFIEEPVPFDSLPKAAREAVVDHCPGAGGFDAVRLTQGDQVCFNVVARRGRIEMSVTVSPAGDVMEFEVDVSPSRLPKAVRATLEREFDGTSFDRIGAVTMHFFELQYEDADGFRRILQMDASGKVLADLDDDRFEGDEGLPGE